MLSTMSHVFSIDPPQTYLTITHQAALANIPDRRTLFGFKTYYFVGSFATSTNSPNFPSDTFSITIDFIDSCTTATIVPQTITFTDVNVTDNETFSFNAFDDTVDSAGDICGAKTFSITSQPGFLSVINGSDLNTF